MNENGGARHLDTLSDRVMPMHDARRPGM